MKKIGGREINPYLLFLIILFKYSGKINGEPARWMYYEDYLKLDDKEGII